MPSQRDRALFFGHLVQFFVEFDASQQSEAWQARFVEFLALQSPSFSWSDLNACIKSAVNSCTSTKDPARCCALCLLQSVQKHRSDSAILQNAIPSRRVASDLRAIDVFDDVFETIGGSQSLKAQLIQTIVEPCLHWEKYKPFARALPTGILLYGPPGTGKTAISRACSRLGHLNFLCPHISDLVNKEIGESERRIRELFAQAERCAPCIIFFDEIESVFKNRTMQDVSWSAQQVVTQLLLKMDDVRRRNQTGGNKFVFIIGATNLPEVFSSDEWR